MLLNLLIVMHMGLVQNKGLFWQATNKNNNFHQLPPCSVETLYVKAMNDLLSLA